MNPNPVQVPKSRQELLQELSVTRREAMKASERGDFRAVARLTLEAARLNRAIADTLPREEITR